MVISVLCTICFSKLAVVHDWDTVKEKKYFFSVQVLFFYIHNPHGAVVVGRKTHFVPGRVFEPSHICVKCFPPPSLPPVHEPRRRGIVLHTVPPKSSNRITAH